MSSYMTDSVLVLPPLDANLNFRKLLRSMLLIATTVKNQRLFIILYSCFRFYLKIDGWIERIICQDC